MIRLFSAIGALISIEKTKCFLWKWTIEKGKCVIKNCDEDREFIIDQKVIGKFLKMTCNGQTWFLLWNPNKKEKSEIFL